jgi:hypothetical protein
MGDYRVRFKCWKCIIAFVHLKNILIGTILEEMCISKENESEIKN